MKLVAAVIAVCVAGILLVAVIGALGLTPDVQALAGSLAEAKGWALVVGILVVAAIVYFLPSLIALRRDKQNKLAIFLLNLFLGWTFVGWVFAIVWAATVDRPTAV